MIRAPRALAALGIVTAMGCGKEGAGREMRDAEAHTASDPKTPKRNATIDLDDLVPKGVGWKCVYGRCERRCTYPRSARVDTEHGAPSLPPCLDQETAFCVGIAMSPGNPPAAKCFTTPEACEKERSEGSLGATPCVARR